MFAALSVMSFVTGRPYNGYLFVAFAALQAFCLMKHGFKPLSPEMESKIDASDPTKIFPKAPPKQAGE
ncbi:hypothetical protein, partial [Luteolibacter pohnpeiensis]|uniref:hypothetical protein n=1 Tax=Luteolibacter pohnpeiensis TaxID=454153 RepID=UPI001F25FA6B